MDSFIENYFDGFNQYLPQNVILNMGEVSSPGDDNDDVE